MIIKKLDITIKLHKEQITQFYTHQAIDELFWKEESFLDFLTNPSHCLFAGFHNSDIFSFALTKTYPDFVELIYIYVEPSHRKSQAATSLLDYTKEHFKKSRASSLQLEVRSTNIAAITLYKKLNFIVCGVRRDYYSDGENALLMTCPI